VIFVSSKTNHNSLIMEQIPSLLKGISNLLPTTNIHQLVSIIIGIYTISSGGVTQRNISRYSDISYRGVARFMAIPIEWHKVLIQILGRYLLGNGVYLLAIDETVEDKAGKSTDKIGYFFCSKAQRVIKSVSFGVLSIISVKDRKSYVTDFTQLEQDKEKAAKNKAKKAARKVAKVAKKASKSTDTVVKKAGRPKGSKNKVAEKTVSISYAALEKMLNRVLSLFRAIGIIPPYLVGDGAYGNITGCLIAAEHGLDLISKLHWNTALYYAPEKGSKKRKYGERVDFSNLDEHKIGEEVEDDCILTYFQMKGVKTRHIDQFINVVILRCHNLKTNKYGFVLLFSTDSNLEGLTLVDYYALRFQIEFNFRDAKQYFGLSDFKSIKPVQVTNSVGISFLMVNLSHILIDQTKEAVGVDFLSIQDLKSYFRSVFYANRLKNTPDFTIPNILDPLVSPFLANLGGVNWGKASNKPKIAA
jgi:putative transposase